MRIASLVATALIFVHCTKTRNQTLPPDVGTSNGLVKLGGDLLAAAERDDREQLANLFASTVLTPEEWTAVFGGAATPFGARYQSTMAELVKRAPVELVAQVYENKYDSVEVMPIVPDANETHPTDRAIARALRTPLRWFSLRLYRRDRPGGLLYRCFFFWNGHWRTANSVGRWLLEAGGSP